MLLLGVVCGCDAIAPLDGLTSGDGPADHSVPGDDAVTDGAIDPDAPTEADAPATDAPAYDGSSTGDGGVAPDAQPPGDAETSDAADSGHAPEGGPTDAGGEGSAPPSIGFVQITVATPSGTSASVSATYAKAQAAGDLNVVVVGWNDVTSTVSSVTDTAGNTYALATGPTQYAPDLTQSIYYAPNIHAATAGSNAVKVAFGQAANVVDLRVLEYSGLDPSSPLDVAAAGTGNGAGPAASGTITTSYARELLVGAGMSTDIFSGAGTSFTKRAVTSDGDIVEDRIVSSIGPYTATAPLSSSCIWVMQIAAFH